MAQLELFAERKSTHTSDGPRRIVEEDIDPTIEISKVLTGKEELGCISTKGSSGCAPLQLDPTLSSSEYFSTRIQSFIESRSAFGTTLESEIEASKEHWSELLAGNGAEGSAEANLEVFRSLQQQYGGPQGFFQDWSNGDWYEVGEKIAEGAQGEIYEVRWLRLDDVDLDNRYVMKVFKEGSSLEDLQKQWPPGMLLRARTSEEQCYWSEANIASIVRGLMLKDGRFAFRMPRYWGDLRKMIDLRMEHNGNQAPLFLDDTALFIMHLIARAMTGLHKDNVVHRDLKASNVLILPFMWLEKGISIPQDGFNPTSDDNFSTYIADYECSIGVVGTRFWRAPEILLGVKNHNIQLSLFTKKVDVYAYPMTCYEVLTGKIPLENLGPKDYDVVLQGARPILPSGTEPWIKSLLSRCWHHDPSKRPSFQQIVNRFEYRKGCGLLKCLKWHPMWL